MRIFRSVAVIALSAIVLSVATARSAFALAGRLSSAYIGHSASYPADARKKVRAALQRKDCKFLGGSFVNSNTFLRYAGDAGSLSRFISDLVKCPGMTVTVEFKKRDDKCDWYVSHDARTNSF